MARIRRLAACRCTSDLGLNDAGLGAKDGDHKYESLTTLDPWIPPTEGLTVVHRQLKLPPFGWIPTEQAWPAFESEVLARVKAELAQFKEEAEAHFKASRLERKKSKRTDPRMRGVASLSDGGKARGGGGGAFRW